jgi:hypothetical protein
MATGRKVSSDHTSTGAASFFSNDCHPILSSDKHATKEVQKKYFNF